MRTSIQILLLVVAVFLLSGCTRAGGRSDTGAKVKAVTLDARRAPSAAMLSALKETGITHIALVQFGFQRDATVPGIRMQTDGNWFSESDHGARELAQQAESLGMRIILKPHLWLGRYNTAGQSRSTIGYDSDEEWKVWEAQYRALIMHYAMLAEEIRAEMLVVGTELARSAKERPEYWRDLIANVRRVYHGQLTYAANWWEEYEHITFWDALDYIGIQAYFELSLDPDPDAAMLRAGWEPHKKAIKALATRSGKPVLFTEIGYRNVHDAAAKPWRWPSRDEMEETDPDDALQAELYEAFFQSVWHEAWFGGVILWKYHSDNDRRRNFLGFSPQGNPAEDVIRFWFTRK